MSVLQITKSMMWRICPVNFEIMIVNILGSAKVRRVSRMRVRKILTRITTLESFTHDLANVRYSHLADIPSCTAHVCFRG
jgi:hypothetical protein